jgi:hypothetical protein
MNESNACKTRLQPCEGSRRNDDGMDGVPLGPAERPARTMKQLLRNVAGAIWLCMFFGGMLGFWSLGLWAKSHPHETPPSWTGYGAVASWLSSLSALLAVAVPGVIQQWRKNNLSFYLKVCVVAWGTGMTAFVARLFMPKGSLAKARLQSSRLSLGQRRHAGPLSSRGHRQPGCCDQCLRPGGGLLPNRNRRL